MNVNFFLDGLYLSSGPVVFSSGIDSMCAVTWNCRPDKDSLRTESSATPHFSLSGTEEQLIRFASSILAKLKPSPAVLLDTLTVGAVPEVDNKTGRQQILDAVAAAVLKDRNKAYGNPEDNFANIAYLWNWYLEQRMFSEPKKPFKITPIDVAHMHGLMKYARLSTNPYHRDSVVDVAGYAACAGDMVKSNELYQKEVKAAQAYTGTLAKQTGSNAEGNSNAKDR